MKSQIRFAEEKLKEALVKLKTSKTEDQRLYKWINRALDDIEEDVFCATQVPKKLIPKVYLEKYSINNLWKYDLPSGWRLLYSVANNDIVVLAIIIEWFSHKEYERKFNY